MADGRTRPRQLRKPGVSRAVQDWRDAQAAKNALGEAVTAYRPNDIQMAATQAAVQPWQGNPRLAPRLRPPGLDNMQMTDPRNAGRPSMPQVGVRQTRPDGTEFSVNADGSINDYGSPGRRPSQGFIRKNQNYADKGLNDVQGGWKDSYGNTKDVVQNAWGDIKDNATDFRFNHQASNAWDATKNSLASMDSFKIKPAKKLAKKIKKFF